MLLYGLLTGVVFGFLLQKGRVLRYDRQVGALRFMDMTILKFMLSAMLVGSVGIYLFKDMGIIELKMKPLELGANVVGGLIFGVGWGFLGYCPGTSAGTLGEGRWDALFGLAGMVLGAGLYAEAYPFLKTNVLAWGNYGELTVPGALGVSHWLVIPVFILATIALFRWFEKKGL